jgi:hypothetical protein
MVDGSDQQQHAGLHLLKQRAQDVVNHTTLATVVAVLLILHLVVFAFWVIKFTTSSDKPATMELRKQRSD